MLKPDDIYKATNGGLDVILSYYPDAIKSASDPRKPFKIRSESTPSAFLREKEGVWRVIDFGNDGHTRSCFDIAMAEDNLTFSEALYRLAGRYGVKGGINAEINKAKFDRRAATDDEPEGNFKFELNEHFSAFELSVLGPRVKEEHCRKLKYHSVKWYSKTKDRHTTTVSSTEHYPIFMRECTYEHESKQKVFYKVYQPLNSDKGFRFFYAGEKPAEYINGMAELEKEYKEFAKRQEADFDDKTEFQDKEDKEGKEKVFKAEKLDEAIICSGERDALCVASLGYFPLWFNSETYKVSEKEMRSITNCVKRVYNIPDIDSTGIRKGTELAMQYIDVYTVWLPDWLRTYTDMRGKPRKDLRDFVELRPSIPEFKNLLKMATPCKFWEERVFEKGYRHEINTEYLYHFLKLSGFGTIDDRNSKTQFMYVKVVKNVVSRVNMLDIKAHVRDFIKKRAIGIEILNLVNNSTRLAEATLNSLERLKLDFTDFDKYRQFLFFSNKTWEVTPSEVIEHRPDDITRNVWEDRVIPNEVKRTTDSFSISMKDDDTFDIQVNHKESNYFRYLINTSRIHWRKELEELNTANPEEYAQQNKFEIAGELLTAEERYEQKLHLINKIFAIGYLLHRYKAPNRAWCVLNMDNKINDDTESNGRSGKSFFMKGVRMFKKTVFVSGRNPKVADNPHIFDRVTEHTDFVMVDDAYDYFPFAILFDKVTGDFEVNPKNNQTYEIPFEKAPKIGITTNFVLRDHDASTEGRLLYCVFSDYYHIKTDNNNYLESRTIFDDFGKNLFMEDYSRDEWNHDMNFFADCIKFYLSTIDRKFSNGDDMKIQPPMKIVSQRRLKAIMGLAFEEWARTYFTPEGEHVDVMVKREDAFNDYIRCTNSKGITSQGFMKKLKAYCLVSSSVKRLNPDEFKNSEGRLIRKVEGKTYEMIFVQTSDEIDLSEITQKPATDDLQF